MITCSGFQRGERADHKSVGRSARGTFHVQSTATAADVCGNHQPVAARANVARGVGESCATRHAAQGDDHAGDYGTDTTTASRLPCGGNEVYQVLQ